MPKPKPIVLFAPGSFSLLSAYEPFFDKLSAAGITVQGIVLPTIGPASKTGRESPAPSMYDDAEVIALAAEKLADEGKDVILMGHSYAGVPISQCTKGLGKEARRAKGKPGGIVHLAYVACLVPGLGESARDLLDSVPEGSAPPSVSVDDYGWMQMDHPENFTQLLCQDLPDEQGKAMLSALAKHSARSFADELSYAGYKAIPSSFLLCEEDRAGPPEFQRRMIAKMEEASGRKVAVTGIDASHSVILSRTEEVVKWVRGVVDECC